jgi:hypothetical protein
VPESGMNADRWKEATSSAIALAIVTISLALLWRTFSVAAPTEGQQHIVLTLVSLLGTVTGYYFGRVPAELRAQSAETAGKEAEARAQQSRAIARDTVESVLDSLTSDNDTRALDARQEAVTRLRALRDVL